MNAWNCEDIPKANETPASNEVIPNLAPSLLTLPDTTGAVGTTEPKHFLAPSQQPSQAISPPTLTTPSTGPLQSWIMAQPQPQPQPQHNSMLAPNQSAPTATASYEQYLEQWSNYCTCFLQERHNLLQSCERSIILNFLTEF